MIFRRITLMVALILFAAGTASAGGDPDPKILIAGTGYSQILISPYFSFTATSTGGGTFDFLNGTMLDWEELWLDVALPYGWIDDAWVPLNSSGYYDLGSELFLSNSISFVDDGVTLHFWGVDESHPGIPGAPIIPGLDFRDQGSDSTASHFSIILDDSPGVPDVGGWLGEDHQPLTFSALGGSAPIPEPTSGILVLSGLLVVGLGVGRRKLLRQRGRPGR